MARKTELIDNVIGANLKCIRNLKGITQKNLSEAVGVTFQQIQKYENGRNRISVSMLIKIAEFMNEHPSNFMSGATRFNEGDLVDNDLISKDAISLLRDYNRISDSRIKSSIRELLCAYVAGHVKNGES